MEELSTKLNRIIEFMEGIHYSRLFKNAVIVLSFSILHFFGYVYFAFNGVPPFVDFKSFSSLIFVAGGFLAVAGLLSRVIGIFFVRFLFPYASMLSTSRRRLMHIKLRVERRKNNGFIEPSEGDLKQHYQNRIIDRTHRVYNNALEFPERRYDLAVRYALLAAIFSFLYLGWKIALICVAAVVAYSFMLFFAYSFVFMILETVSVFTISRITSESDRREGIRIWDVLRLLGISFRSIFKLKVDYLKTEKQFFKLFASANIGLILVISALVFGIGRSAHILGTESFDISITDNQSSDVLSTSVVLVTSNGILGVLDDDRSMLFVPFDAAPVIKPNKDIHPRSYTKLLIRMLFPIG